MRVWQETLLIIFRKVVNKIPISVKLYGELRERFSYKKVDAGIPNTLEIEVHEFRTVLDILKQLSIDENEISHIFVNGILSGAGKMVKDGDRIGIFPKRMGLMFLELSLEHTSLYNSFEHRALAILVELELEFDNI